MARGRKTGGRQKGSPNKITRAFREAVQRVYKGLGGDKHFKDWAKESRQQFGYQFRRFRAIYGVTTSH